jgi:membrane protein DedA with SNARE-associated domain
MTPELLLQKFGYLAVFVGTFLEGETILVMAGFFAERGYLTFSGSGSDGRRE